MTILPPDGMDTTGAAGSNPGASAYQQPGTPLPQQQQQPYGPQPSAGPPPPTNTLAIIAFVGSFFVSIAGIICGHIALGQIKRTGERGRGFALAGTIIGYVVLALEVLAIVLVLVISAFAAQVVSSTAGDSAPTPPATESPMETPDPDADPEDEIDVAGGWTAEYCEAWEAYRFSDAWYGGGYADSPERQAETLALMQPLAEIPNPQRDYWQLVLDVEAKPEPVTPEETLQQVEDKLAVANGMDEAWDASDKGCGLD